MPPRKTPASKPAEPEVAEAAVADPPADATPETSAYTAQAATLAAETRDFTDDVRDRAAALVDAVNDLGSIERTVAESPVWDAARRITMACGDLTRALDGVTSAAADLAAKAAQ
jgi:hypothetical protein